MNRAPSGGVVTQSPIRVSPPEGQLVEPRDAWLPQDARELFTERSRLLKTDCYLLQAPINTQRARRADWALFCAFCEASGVAAMPANPDTVVAFLEAVHATPPLTGGRPRQATVTAASQARRLRRERLAREGTAVATRQRGRVRGNQRAAKTLERYISTVAAAHRFADVVDPTRTARVRNALHALMGKLRLAQPRAPLRRELLLKLLGSLWPAQAVPSFAGSGGADPTSSVRAPALPRGRRGWLGAPAFAAQLWDLRARALLACLYPTMARRSEVIELCYQDLPHDASDGVVAIQARKTGQRDHRYLDSLAMRSVAAWCHAAGIRSGPVFRSLDCRGRIGDRAIRAPQVLGIIRAVWAHGAPRPAAAEEPGSDSAVLALRLQDVGAHSSRIGAAHDLVAAGQDLLAIMHSGGWKDARMPRRYIQELQARDSGMARMLGKRPARSRELTSEAARGSAPTSKSKRARPARGAGAPKAKSPASSGSPEATRPRGRRSAPRVGAGRRDTGRRARRHDSSTV